MPECDRFATRPECFCVSPTPECVAAAAAAAPVSLSLCQTLSLSCSPQLPTPSTTPLDSLSIDVYGVFLSVTHSRRICACMLGVHSGAGPYTLSPAVCQGVSWVYMRANQRYCVMHSGPQWNSRLARNAGMFSAVIFDIVFTNVLDRSHMGFVWIGLFFFGWHICRNPGALDLRLFMPWCP